MRACCGTNGVTANPEIGTAATNKVNAAKADLATLSLQYDVQLYASTVAWAEFNAAKNNDTVVWLSGAAQTVAVWAAFYKVAHDAYSAPSNAARDAIWNAYLNRSK